MTQAIQFPSERTIEAGQAGKDAPGFAFACYVSNVAAILRECDRVTHDPTPVEGVNLRTGEPEPAGQDAAWVCDINRIQRESSDAQNALRGIIIREARAGGYGDSARAELDAIEAALSRLWDASFDDSAQASRDVVSALVTAERRLWDEIEHAKASGTDKRNTEHLVRDYINSQREAGRPIDELTRDGISSAVKVSGGRVSTTKAWKALAAEKRQAKLPGTPDEAVFKAAHKRDWDAVQRLQEQEQRRMTGKSQDNSD